MFHLKIKDKNQYRKTKIEVFLSKFCILLIMMQGILLINLQSNESYLKDSEFDYSYSNLKYRPQTSNLNDSDASIYCDFENSLNDYKGHTSFQVGTWTFNSEYPINGSYGIEYNDEEVPAYIRYTDPTDYNEGTVECFFNPTDLEGDHRQKYIMGASDGTYPILMVFLNSNNTIYAGHYNASAENTAYLNSSYQLISNVTYHIAYSWGPTGNHLYINGIEVANSSDTRILQSSSLYWGIGRPYTLGSHTNIYAAKGIYDVFRVSTIQRTDFSYVSVIKGDSPESPILDPISSPEEGDDVSLYWNSVSGAEFYAIYRYEFYINENNISITLVNLTLNNYHIDQDLPNNAYFYVIIAANRSGWSSISNCESVVIENNNIGTNRRLQEIQTGVNYVHCSSSNDIVWMKCILISHSIFNLNLTYSTLNPFEIQGPDNSQLSHFYSIESNIEKDIENVVLESLIIHFYYPSNFNSDQENDLFLYKYNGTDWQKIESQSYPYEKTIFLFEGKLNSIYAIGYASIEDQKSLNQFSIFGYNQIALGLISVTILIKFCILKKNLKK